MDSTNMKRAASARSLAIAAGSQYNWCERFERDRFSQLWPDLVGWVFGIDLTRSQHWP